MPALFGLIEGLWLQIGPVLNLDLRSGPERLKALAAHEHHAHLVAALESRDGVAARRALVGDIESAADYILSLGRLTGGEVNHGSPDPRSARLDHRGGSGIGLATARAFAREGARVHVSDIDEQALDALAASDPALSRSVCDVADPDAVARLFATAQTALGGLDAMVNNAGIAGPTAPCEDVALRIGNAPSRSISPASSSARSTRSRCSRRAQRQHDQPVVGRRPLRLSQPDALRGGEMGRDRIHQIAVDRARDFGIRVNAICPGSVAGARIDSVYANKAKLRGVAPDVVRDEALAKTSLQRLVTADDIANAIVFLASPLGANISGHALPVDADTHALV